MSFKERYKSRLPRILSESTNDCINELKEAVEAKDGKELELLKGFLESFFTCCEVYIVDKNVFKVTGEAILALGIIIRAKFQGNTQDIGLYELNKFKKNIREALQVKKIKD